MVASNYVPDSGDIVWVDLNPTKGHEQKGKRPAVVISPKLYNLKSNLAILCPITSHPKGYPFEVSCLVKREPSVVLADQIKMVDWKARKIKFIEKFDPSAFSKLKEKITVLIGF